MSNSLALRRESVTKRSRGIALGLLLGLVATIGAVSIPATPANAATVAVGGFSGSVYVSGAKTGSATFSATACKKNYTKLGPTITVTLKVKSVTGKVSAGTFYPYVWASGRSWEGSTNQKIVVGKTSTLTTGYIGAAQSLDMNVHGTKLSSGGRDVVSVASLPVC